MMMNLVLVAIVVRIIVSIIVVGRECLFALC